MRHRNRVLALLSLLAVITYLDRVCISVAGPRMQAALHISPVGWGWVGSAFILAYGLFEIPSGMLADRIGARKVLTRVVTWWSIFTSLTAAAMGFYPLLLVRFLFGMGEAGAFPGASVAVARWFPLRERGRAFGIILTSVQAGGALAPLLVVPIQMRYGWRASFIVFGLVGILWSILWFLWYRDSPSQKPGVTPAELAELRGLERKTTHGLPWKQALKSWNLWATLGAAYCYIYTFNFFQTWFHTYLVKARHFSEGDLLLSSYPFVVAGLMCLAGGLTSNKLVERFGLRTARRAIGFCGLTLAGICAAAVIFTPNRTAALVLLSLTYGGITFQQPTMFAVCLDIGGEYAGAVIGAMNTASQVGSFVASLVFGWIVEHYATRPDNYDLPFWPMAFFLIVGGLLYLRIDATEQLIPEPI